MKTLSVLTVVALVVLQSVAGSPLKFRGGVFLHHSTGERIWGPNGSPTSVPLEIARYNGAHSLAGSDSVRLNELAWPTDPWDNEWERWHRIFDNQDTSAADIRPLLQENRIIMMKSCFPSSSMTARDYLDSMNRAEKSIPNYKWHWRSMLQVMRERPFNFFVIWTNAPLVAAATTDEQASISDRFCRWAKDTLARGRDPEFGSLPPNVHIFDFFHFLAGTDGKLPDSLASNPGDSHPNAAATQRIAPRLVTEIFDAALAYEGSLKPVTYGSFTASPSSPGFRVALRWMTTMEIGNLGFFVERRVGGGGTFARVSSAMIVGNGTTTRQHQYAFVDSTMTGGGEYHFRLAQLGTDSLLTYSDTLKVVLSATGVLEIPPARYALAQNFPNPFNPSAEILFTVGHSGEASLDLYDILGRPMEILFRGPVRAGETYRVLVTASSLPSGAYFYRLRTEAGTLTRRMMVLK